MTVPESNEVKFKALRDDLHRRYDHVVDSAEVDRVLDELIDDHASKANVQTFVPIIVERDAAEALEDRGCAMRSGATAVARSSSSASTTPVVRRSPR
ncbi:hypothetical protein C3B44_10975 [Corynebacterium yudongzhengii]|uniref:Uncharacterized protein n=1 Tax=Corynebacterium yudongzhengii TaxID=2080740 RepID=A0A2U1T844_9CORY|nr:hypothetical protein [Corynebacterium yudongzhengii]AWB82788.1 hypothetical protein C3B44_10975 [Corynebacterium yudongzhengii]PWC02152.1 hypothetical protein DF222_03420 [Corynebacterium yudongzhengii]